MIAKDIQNIGLLTIAFIIISILVNPIGEFCLYDDFSFTRSMQTFHESGRIAFSDWTSMPLIAQLLYANIFTYFFGFSLTVLRFSTIFAGLLAIHGTYFFFKEHTENSKKSLFYTVSIVICAVFLNFVYSFNTDIPFYTAIIWSMFFFLRFLKSTRISSYIFAIVMLLIGIMIRDIGIAVAIAFGVGYLLKSPINFKSIIIAFIPMLLGFAAIILWKQFLISIDSVPALYDDGRARMLGIFELSPQAAIAFIAKNIIWFAAYIGVFLSPLFLANSNKIIDFIKSHRIFSMLIASIAALFLAVGIIYDKFAVKFTELLIHHIFGMTFWGNVHQIESGTLIRIAPAWNIFALIIGIIGLLLFTIFIAITAHKIFSRRAFNQIKSEPFIIFSIAAIAVYIFPLLLAGIYMKYLLFVFPFVIILIDRFLSDNELRINKLAAIAAALIFYFTLATTHDILSEERARWIVAEKFYQSGQADLKEIDGGICFNGYFLYSHSYQKSEDKNWWWVYEDKFLVADGKVSGYEIQHSYSYRRFLPLFQRVTIYGLKRE